MVAREESETANHEKAREKSETATENKMLVFEYWKKYAAAALSPNRAAIDQGSSGPRREGRRRTARRRQVRPGLCTHHCVHRREL
ncbi:hypothetical protein PC122_g19317 [Phytophthora cactorum]|nr:hypothetical protein PC122_g19317 [Phytophthora cactorum]